MNDGMPAREQERLLYELIRAGHLMEMRLLAALEPCGLSLPKLAVLQTLVKAGGRMPLGALSERLGCVKSNVTQLVDRLETDRLVQRVGDPEDRRSVLAVITEEGRQRYEAGRRVVEEAEREILNGFSAGDRERLAGLLGRLDDGDHG